MCVCGGGAPSEALSPRILGYMRGVRLGFPLIRHVGPGATCSQCRVPHLSNVKTLLKKVKYRINANSHGI